MIPIKSRISSKGYVLVGVLALAVLVAVAASMAILSSQQKVDEVRNKTTNIEAKLAMDSQAARILTYLDGALEFSGTLKASSIPSVLSGDMVSGPYRSSVTLASKAEQTSEFPVAIAEPQDLSFAPNIMYALPLQFHPQDPLFPDMRMNVREINVKIEAQASATVASNYVSTYTFQVRAIPVSDFALFNPGPQAAAVSISRDVANPVFDGVLHQQNAWAYVGNLTGPSLAASGAGSLHVIEAQHTAADPGARLYRSRPIIFPSSGIVPHSGAAKWQNASSLGFATILGRYDNLLSAYQDDAVNQFGLMYHAGSEHDNAGRDPNSTVDPISGYEAAALSLLGGATSPLQQAYSIVQVPSGNPFYTEANQGYITTLDLGSLVSSSFNPLTPEQSFLLSMPPSTNGSQITLVLVTNCSYIGRPCNVSFPPSVNVFIADDVNTNGTPLRMEGNIGFIPKLPDNVLTLTNMAEMRSSNPICAVTHDTTVLRPAVLVDVSNAVNQAFIYTPEYVQLEQELRNWATNVQIQLLSGPGTSCYIPNAGAINFLLDDLRLYRLNESCQPVVGLTTGWITNMVSEYTTNIYHEYSFAGWSMHSNGCVATQVYYNLNGNMADEGMPSNSLAVPVGGLGFTDKLITTVTNADHQTFSDPWLDSLHNSLSNPVDGEFVDYAQLYTWIPSNATESTLIPAQGTKWFAITWMTIEPLADNQPYYESFNERYQLAQNTQTSDEVTNSAHQLSDFAPTEPRGDDPAMTWYGYLKDNWVANVPEANAPTDYTFRYDSSGTLSTDNVGAWRRTWSTVEQTVPDMGTEVNRRTSDLTNHLSLFNERQVVFHYQTLGWTLTNVIIVAGQAPGFSGRLVVEDGIKRPMTLLPTNLVVHGQVTYTQRIKAFDDPSNVIGLNAYGIEHNQRTYPENCSERIYDVRISRVDTRRR
jgi:hypothetical protein